MSEVVLITGANKGLGFQTARVLGKRGFHVLLAARSAELGAAAVNTNMNPAPVVDMRREMEVNYFGVVNVTNAFIPLLSKAENPRIVNLSSILGSHGAHANPESPIYGHLTSGYNASKAALNMYTQNLSIALKNFKVNSAHPGWVKTDMGGENAPLNIDEGVETSVALATLDKDGPTGKFFHRGQEVPW